MTMIVEPLLNLGLSQKEAEVYLSALQLGFATVQQIAQKAEINRTTAYTHIRSLISRGLVNATTHNGRACFVAAKPDVLKDFWEQQELEIKRRKEVLDQIMPELQSLYNLSTDRPSVKLYESDNLNLFRDYIINKRADELLNIFNYEMFKDFINRDHVSRLLNSTLSFKVLYIAKQKILDRRLHQFFEYSHFHIRYLPYDRFNFLCEILVGDKSTYINRQTEYLVISDPAISATFKILFNSLWGLAEKFD